LKDLLVREGERWRGELRTLSPLPMQARGSTALRKIADFGISADDRVTGAIVCSCFCKLGTCRVVADTVARRHAYDLNYQATVQQK